MTTSDVAGDLNEGIGLPDSPRNPRLNDHLKNAFGLTNHQIGTTSTLLLVCRLHTLLPPARRQRLARIIKK